MNTQILRFSVSAVCLGLGAALLPAPVSAMQSALPVSARSAIIRPGIPASDSEITPAVRVRLARGDELTGSQRFAAAENEYRFAADIGRREGHLPSYTLWHLASAYYYQGDPQRAAGVLEQLAVEASQSGDLVVQALALFNAAWLNGEAGHGRVAATELTDLSRLLRSPYMPNVVREVLMERMPTGAVAVTP
jgi:hypothetical protein